MLNKLQALTIRQLKLAIVLGEVHSVQVAASMLNIAQSSATKSLQKIELLFDTTIFHRSSKGLLPTAAGLVIIRHANTILKTLEQAERDVQSITDGRSGELRVGSPNGASRVALQKAIVSLSETYSDVAISVKEAASFDLLSMLTVGELDCVIGRRACSTDIPGTEFHHLYTEIACLSVRPGHVLAGQANVRLQDLADYGWILPPSEMRVRQAIDASFGDASMIPPNRFVETIGLQGKHLLLESEMIGIWPYQSIRKEYLNGEMALLNIALPRTITQIGLSVAAQSDCSVFFKDFCQYVQGIGKDIEENHTEWRTLFLEL